MAARDEAALAKAKVAPSAPSTRLKAKAAVAKAKVAPSAPSKVPKANVGVPKAKAALRALNTRSKAKARCVYQGIAKIAGLTEAKTKSVLDAIPQSARQELRKSGVFIIPNLVMLRVLRKGATVSKIKSMFGKDVHIAAKPVRNQLKATVLKHMRDSVGEK